MNKDTTSTVSPEASDIVEAEALAWIAQLNGDDISEKDLSAFREWVQRSPAHQKEIIELGKFWQDLNILTAMDEVIGQADKISKNLRKEYSQRKWQKHRVALSAIACTILALALIPSIEIIFLPASPETTENVITMPLVFKSGVGKKQSHVLRDGTVITLNTISFVEVDYADKQRNVRLIKGEALFNVAHDKNRPFLVFANDGIIRVLGTEFSVRLQPDKIGVIVAKGSVELSTFSSAKPQNPDEPDQANPAKMANLGVVSVGQSAELQDHTASIKLISQEAMNAKLSWTEGLLVFRGESLAEVIEEVSRYTDIHITIDDPELQALRIGGVFKSGDNDVLFRALETQFAIVTENVNDHTVRLIRRH